MDGKVLKGKYNLELFLKKIKWYNEFNNRGIGKEGKV